MRTLRMTLAAIACGLAGAPAIAQQAVYTTAPTLPGKGQVVTRHLLHFTSYHDDGVSGDDVTLVNTISYGLTSELAVQFDLPYRWRDVEGLPGGDIDNSGLLDSSLSFKWRVWKHDPGPVDTVRFALIGGLQLPTGADRVSSDSFDPFLGASLMRISGRHGFGVSAQWLFTTGGIDGDAVNPGDTTDDVLNLDASYLFRLAPATYGEEFAASLYAVLELNTVYETNGDAEAFLSPGLLYEAPRFAIEAAVQLPVAQDLAHRPEREYVVTLGLRLLF